MTVTERRAVEVDRQKKRNKKDLLVLVGRVVVLILWALCLAGFFNGGLR